jgi:hypothetical protein
VCGHDYPLPKAGPGHVDTRTSECRARYVRFTYDHTRDVYRCPRWQDPQHYRDGRELKTSDSSSTAAEDVTAGTPIWQQVGSADNIAILQAGAKLYNRSQAMQDLAKNGGQFASPTEGHVVSDDVLFVFGMHSQIARNISDLQDKGMTDQAQALSDALQNGTLKFQKASDVPDLNMNSWMIHFADAGGGGEMGSSSVKPTGTIKAAIEGGKALAVNMGDRGDFYVTW